MLTVPLVFYQFLLISIWCELSQGGGCPEPLSQCSCGQSLFDDKQQYIVNCTDTKFNDTLPLHHMPDNTEVLIFTGNFITDLPWNVFGSPEQTPENLRVVDMSNNYIREVLGKSYHGVSNVRRLILNHNQISISQDEHHPRVFSNFVNLEELHLTNAFEDNAQGLGMDLHDIFVKSNLTKLIKLHLEQNEITKFRTPDVFCDLPSILDLYLGDNRISQVDFRVDCLKHLRFIDLEGNNITRLMPSEMAALDALPARNQTLEINLSDNPFSCECGIHQLFDWIQTTKVSVSESYRLHCHRNDGEHPPKHPENVICDEPIILTAIKTSDSPVVAVVLCFLSFIVLSLAGFLVYSNRKSIRHRLQPMVETVSRKVYYSSIGHNDDQEIEV